MSNRSSAVRSRADFVRIAALCAALALAPAANALTPQDIRKAAAEVAKDPDLGGTRKEKELRLREDSKPDPKRPEQDTDPGWVRWITRIVHWVSEAGRVFVWTLGAVLVALLAVGIHRWMRVRGEALLPAIGAVPTHVQGLDIRAASLPDLIGAAAAQLWQSGERRAALSLLYRGALSRLVHRHGVPVRGSSTESECLRLARKHVDAQRGDYFARLVQVWELAVYGARLPDDPVVTELCGAFDALWPAQVQGVRA
jgi:hypothetical protein